MQFNKAAIFVGVINKLLRALPAIFFILLIFGFDKPFIGFFTILCALIHEAGHIIACKFLKVETSIKFAASGPRIKPHATLSYKDELIIAASGPCINIAVAILSFALGRLLKEALPIFGILNLFTALANLFPLRGYDGYRILNCIINIKKTAISERSLKKISLCINFFVCFISLYIILVVNSGYWIYFLFLCNAISDIKDALPTKLEENRENKSIREFLRVFYGKIK